MMLPANAALIVVDVQQGFDDPMFGKRNNPQAEDNIGRVLETWRRAHRPIFHIQHLSRELQSPLRPDQPGCALKPVAQPHEPEPVIQKHVNSAFIGTDLEARLHAAGIDTVVIVGLTTNHCISTTARMAGNLGFTTYVVSDATATFDRMGHDGQLYLAQLVHDISLANLNEEFAQVVDTDRLLQLAG
jgi:nicotinamidase-related amidase